MSRTLGQLERGTVIKLDENGVLADYYLLDKDNTSTVLLRKDCYIAKRMHSSNVSVYEGCEADEWLNNEATGFLSIFPEAVRNCLVSRNIDVHSYGDTETHTIARKCYILSEAEMFNTGTPKDGKYLLPYLYLCNGITNENNSRICKDANGSAIYWWLRSPGSATQFRGVFTSGTVGNYNATGTSYWLRPALSVANATIVSDEGADEILLLPEGGVNYRKIDAIVYAGQTQHRPKSARVLVNAQGLRNVRVEISNNGRDENPVWVDCTGGNSVELENNQKTSESWELAVHLYGEADGSLGRFGEPLIITEEE